jgi:hypothetical protein
MPGADSGRAYWWVIAAGSAGLALAASLPYLAAQAAAPPEHVFTGLLMNPIDGHTYLAKLREGWGGSWTFTLPYTSEPGLGVFLYTYYLALGHAARWLGLSLVLVFHLARTAGLVAMLLTAGVFVARCLETMQARLAAWLLFALGSGLGWLAVPGGGLTPDLYVAEAFPFLAGLTNAHFGLALALLLWVALLGLPALDGMATSRRRLALLAGATLALAQVHPLGLINAGLVLGAAAAWQAITQRSIKPFFTPRLLVFGLMAAPWLAHGFWLTVAHPAVRGWNAQNVTPSPPAWEWLLAGGAPLALAVVGAVRALRRRTPRDLALVLWLAVGAVALYAPFALQRRLAFGLWAPVCVLAVEGLRGWVWPRLRPWLRPLLVGVVAVAALPSNLLVYAALMGAVQERNPIAFLTQAEAGALRWLGEHARAGDLVAAAPEMGLYVPVWSAARVLYGHPFETLEADAQRALVEGFYANPILPDSFVRQQGIDYVLLGPRERAIGAGDTSDEWQLVYDGGEVLIYAP